MKTEILYEDQDILVVYKPAGIATQAAGFMQADVFSELKSHIWVLFTDWISLWKECLYLPKIRHQQQI